MIPLTVMSDIDRSARSENGEKAGIIDASGVCGAKLDLKAGTESISTHFYRATRQVTYLGAIERRARASAIGDCEGVLGEGVQDSTRIVEEFEGLVTGVQDGHCDLQILQSVDLCVGGRGLDGQAGSSISGDCRSDEDNESGTEGREHRNVDSQSGW